MSVSKKNEKIIAVRHGIFNSRQMFKEIKARFSDEKLVIDPQFMDLLDGLGAIQVESGREITLQLAGDPVDLVHIHVLVLDHLKSSDPILKKNCDYQFDVKIDGCIIEVVFCHYNGSASFLGLG